jgi:hypothetical protein
VVQPVTFARKDEVKMRRLFLIGLLSLTGCQNVIGPFQRRETQRVDDPCLTISEQERRGRDRLALPDDSPRLAPLTDTDPRGANHG